MCSAVACSSNIPGGAQMMRMMAPLLSRPPVTPLHEALEPIYSSPCADPAWVHDDELGAHVHASSSWAAKDPLLC